jgi:hypothetical protein
VPITKHDKPVSVLNVSFNVLKILEEDALLSYESVRYLYLQYCKIFIINEKAFQRLENLTVIDLSSNRLTSIPSNFFSGNKLLDTLIFQRNNLGSLQWNTPILNGPPSLSFLDLQSCKLSNISSITFSLLPNLTFLDISRNKLVLLHNDTLSSHQKLKDVNMENNPWMCGAVFEGLMCWMQSKLSLSHNRTLKCQHMNGTWDIWTQKNRSSLCHLITTSLTGEFLTLMTTDLTVSVGVLLSPETSPHKPRVVETAVTSETELGDLPESDRPITTTLKGEFLTLMTTDLTTVSVGVPLSPVTSPHTPRVVETAVTSEIELGDLPECKSKDWPSFPSWNVKTLMLFLIMSITLGASVSVSLIAVHFFTKRCSVHRSQHHTQEDNQLAACLDSTVPFLNPQLEVVLTNQPLGSVNRSSENVRQNVYHVYEEIR